MFTIFDSPFRPCDGLSRRGFLTAGALGLGGLTLAGLLCAADEDAKEEAIRKEMARLEGTWQLVSAETDGQKQPPERVKQIRVVIRSGKQTVYFGGKAIAEGVPFRIDPAKRPKQVEDTLKDGRKIRGIYELDGDTLRSCVALPDKDRPAEFTGRKGSGYTLRVFRRVRR